MRTFAAVFVGTVTLLGCGSTTAVAQQQPITVPFELYDNVPFVQVRVNGSEPLAFLVDSGADTCLLDSRRAASLGLSVRGQARGTGFGDGAVMLAFARGVSLALGGIDLPRQTVVVYPFAELEPMLGRRLDGVIGRNLFERFVVELDYVGRVMTLHDPKSYVYAGAGTRLPIAFDDDLPLVPGAVTLVTGTPALAGRFLIDTGANDHLDLNTGFVAKHRILDTVPRMMPSSAFGANGESRGRSGRVAALHLGPLVVKDPISGLSEAKRGVEADSDREGRIGGAILSRFRLVFDYSRKAIFFEPSERISDPFEADMSGVSLVAAAPAFDMFTVRDIREDSPGERAGLRPGDVIVAIDGRAANTYTLEQIREMWRRDGATHSLTVERGGATMTTSLTLSRVI